MEIPGQTTLKTVSSWVFPSMPDLLSTAQQDEVLTALGPPHSSLWGFYCEGWETATREENPNTAQQRKQRYSRAVCWFFWGNRNLKLGVKGGDHEEGNGTHKSLRSLKGPVGKAEARRRS